jgi:tape measure domain-containing protein
MQVRLDLMVGDYVKNTKRAADATRSIATAAQAPTSALQRVSQAGAELGQTMTQAAGVGVAALGTWTASAFTMGVAYNSLQQTAGSALETLLGSTEAATAQMEELASFARTSPFPRQMWIQAQQQMIGFGVEAEKIVPIFSALQDGVVAVGGSAQSIEEVVLILSKISSVGKVTAEDLNELGVRGIDAATLVGEAWGMTAAEVRDSMAEGTVDATQFMDTLVEQLGTKYAGAAEGLRETWVGALDRIAGATRDIGSVLAAPFVDPQGGGAAVEWANASADALRAFEAALKPAMEVLSERAEPAFQMAAEAMRRFTEAVGEIDIIEILDHLAAGAPILTAFGAAAVAAGSASALSALGMGGLAAAINPVAAGVLGLAVASPVFRDALMDLLSAVAPLIPMIAALAVQIAEGLTLAIDSLMPFVEVAIGLVGGMVSMFSALPAPIQQAALAVGAFALALKKLGPIGIILTGIGYIATAVSSISGESQEASIDVNTLAEDLKNFQQLGQTFKIQDLNFDAITEPLRNAQEMLNASVDSGGWADMTETGREWVEVGEGVVSVTREMADEQGNLTELVRYGAEGNKEFTESVDTLDKAMAQLVAEGMDADEAFRLVADATGLTHEELQLILPLMDEYNAEAGIQAETTAQAAAEQEEFANKVGASVAALKALADELRAQVDPVFAAVRAMQAYEDAQTAYNEAVDEHGASSEEAIEAEMALIEAYLNAAAAAGEMAKATGGDLPPELLHAAEAAGLGAEAIALLEEQFYATRDAGQQMGNDLANVNADLTTDTGRMAAQNGLELAGMEADYASFVLASKASIDALMASGMSYADAIAFVAANSNRSTSEIEDGFGEARDAGLEFSDDYPATVRLNGVDSVVNQAKRVQSWLDSIQRTVTIAFKYTSSGSWQDFLPRGGMVVPYSTGGPVGGPLGAGDVVPAVLTPGEHVWTRAEVDAAGGHDAIEAMRSAVLAGQTRFAQSGSVMSGGSSTQSHGHGGIYIDKFQMESVTGSFDTRQVRNALMLEAVV